jgi:uracil-DNA glycosylase
LNIGNNWDILLKDEFEKDYFQSLKTFLKKEYSEQIVFPTAGNIFNALRYTDYQNIKAVVLGQDPYPNPNQAHGLCFSVKDGVSLPPSLRNIFKELNSDLGYQIPKNGNLTKWAKAGVLLLNAIMTVRAKNTGSHRGRGWEVFTNRIIELVNEKTTPVVFILWGNDAKKSKKIITNPIHLILEGTHPSPLSAWSGFFGKKYFSKCNDFLKSNEIKPIDWNLED